MHHMGKAQRRGRSHEIATAKRLGGKRTSVLGVSTPDVTSDWLCCECKERQTPTQWLESALQQATAAALPEQLPIVVLHWKGARHDNDIVFLRLRDFEQWFGDVGGQHDGQQV
jgi:hypothetical protein